MTWFNRLFRGKGAAHIPADAAMMITEHGKNALGDYKGDSKEQILLALETRGSCDVEKLSSATGLTRGEVERAVPALLRNGYVRFLTAGGGVGDDL
jgi:hypothetical protein